MRIKQNVFFFAISVFLPFKIFSQSLSPGETTKLYTVIYNYFTTQGPQTDRQIAKYTQGRPSEAFFCLLDIDSSGKVGSLHLLSDNKNWDSAFVIFNKLTPLDFKSWSCEKCMGKTIMIPINISGSQGDDPPKYVKDLIWSNAIKPGEERNLIIIRRMNLGWPTVVQ